MSTSKLREGVLPKCILGVELIPDVGSRFKKCSRGCWVQGCGRILDTQAGAMSVRDGPEDYLIQREMTLLSRRGVE